MKLKPEDSFSIEEIQNILNSYLVDKLSINKIAQKYGISFSTARRIAMSTTAYRTDKLNLSEDKKVKIVELYQQGLSLRDIASIYFTTPNPIIRVLELAGVKRRTSTENTHKIWTNPEYIKKQSERISGTKNMNWKGGTTALKGQIHNLPEYDIWKMNVFHKDNFTCAICGIKNGLGRRIKFNAHHIIFLSQIIADFSIKNIEDALKCDLLWDANNGQCLCKNCHQKLHSDLLWESKVL